ncbi:Phosphoserine phosphatase [Raoultella ornithinolytica]|nr:Phosphoserine phosphatase [Raoultella ornithinolytica]
MIAGYAKLPAGKKWCGLAAWQKTWPHESGEVTFYTDSINDLPLCLHADHVRLVNPCPQLTAVECQLQLPVLAWSL